MFLHTEQLLRTEAFAQRSLYTHTHTHCCHTQALLHTEVFAQASLCTEQFLHTEGHRSRYTETPLHTEAFAYACAIDCSSNHDQALGNWKMWFLNFLVLCVQSLLNDSSFNAFRCGQLQTSIVVGVGQVRVAGSFS